MTPGVVALMVVAVLAASALAAGCASSNTPESVVKRYLSAAQHLDWEAYKKTIKPQDLSKNQDDLAEGIFKSVTLEFSDVETETKYDPEDKNKATVFLVGGKVKTTTSIMGEKKTETIDIAKENAKDQFGFDMVKINGTWYVDKDLP